MKHLEFNLDAYLQCFTEDAGEFVTEFSRTKGFAMYVEELKESYSRVGLPYPVSLVPEAVMY